MNIPNFIDTFQNGDEVVLINRYMKWQIGETGTVIRSGPDSSGFANEGPLITVKMKDNGDEAIGSAYRWRKITDQNFAVGDTVLITKKGNHGRKPEPGWIGKLIEYDPSTHLSEIGQGKIDFPDKNVRLESDSFSTVTFDVWGVRRIITGKEEHIVGEEKKRVVLYHCMKFDNNTYTTFTKVGDFDIAPSNVETYLYKFSGPGTYIVKAKNETSGKVFTVKEPTVPQPEVIEGLAI